jgi:glycosyltransferase involved in cell wall biosynthesis
MIKPLKIIHLSFFAKGEKPPHHPKIGDDYYFVASWAGLIARRLKKYKPDLDIETWRAENEFNEITEKEVFNIKGIIWPHKKVVVKNLLTLDMIKRLNQIKKNYFVILHYHDLYNLRFVILINIFCPGIKVVLSHHGGVPPKQGTIKDRLIKLFYNKNRINYITYLSTKTRDYIIKIKGHPPIKFLPVGADFNVMVPNDKIEMRKILKLDQDKVYAIYVGKWYKLKNVDLILETYQALKEKYNFSVIFVGGSNDIENDLYEQVVNSGCPYFGVQKWTDMPMFYNAADFYIHPAFNSNFGGLDVSWIEALACNKPVLSPQLAYLDFDFTELGIVVKNKIELIEKTEWMINNYKKFTKCREVSQRQLDGNTAIMEKLVKIYAEIYSQTNSHN